MKKTVILAVILLLSTLSAFAQDGRSIYNKYSDEEGVSCVYISPAIFRIIKTLPSVKIDNSDVNLSQIVKSLSGLYVISSESERINSSLIGDVEKYLSKGKFEMLMEAKENGETTHIYTAGDEETVTSFIIMSKERDESTFVCLEGQMSRKELEKMIADSQK